MFLVLGLQSGQMLGFFLRASHGLRSLGSRVMRNVVLCSGWASLVDSRGMWEAVRHRDLGDLFPPGNLSLEHPTASDPQSLKAPGSEVRRAPPAAATAIPTTPTTPTPSCRCFCC